MPKTSNLYQGGGGYGHKMNISSTIEWKIRYLYRYQDAQVYLTLVYLFITLLTIHFSEFMIVFVAT